jgi:hypothetical protein
MKGKHTEFRRGNFLGQSHLKDQDEANGTSSGSYPIGFAISGVEP